MPKNANLPAVALYQFDKDLKKWTPVAIDVDVNGALVISSYAANPVKITDITPWATKITTSGSITYIGIAAPGTAQASALWQAKKIDATDADNVVITWAGGGALNQVATDLTALSYS